MLLSSFDIDDNQRLFTLAIAVNTTSIYNTTRQTASDMLERVEHASRASVLWQCHRTSTHKNNDGSSLNPINSNFRSRKIMMVSAMVILVVEIARRTEDIKIIVRLLKLKLLSE